MKMWTRALAALVMGTAACAAWAQDATRPWEEYSKHIKSAETLAAQGPNLFGDAVNLENGALSFSTTDVSIRGNNALPAAISRSYSVTNRRAHRVYAGSVLQGAISDGAMADWDLDLPRIEGVYASTWANDRCSRPATPQTRSVGSGQTFTQFLGEDYWQGLHAQMPGGGELLQANAGAPRPSSGGHVWMTSGFAYFSCLPTIKNGEGEGFIAVGPDGTHYWFDWMGQSFEPDLKGGREKSERITRRRNVLYVTRIQDRFGNWVTYEYSNSSTSPGRLTAIATSDNRHIALAYNAYGHVAAISTGTRTWTYQYQYPTAATGTLVGVTLPDSSRWVYDFARLSSAGYRYYKPATTAPEAFRDCFNPGDLYDTGATSGTVTHPSGAVGTFHVSAQRFGRSNVPAVCGGWSTPYNDPNDDVAYYPIQWDSMALTRKEVAGPGLTPAAWDYSYNSTISWFYPASGNGLPVCNAAGNCRPPACLSDSCAGTTIATVTGPDNKWERHTFGNSYRYNEGKLLKVEKGATGGAALQTTSLTYNLAQSGQSYATPIGNSPHPRGDGFKSEYIRPQTRSVVALGSDTFTNQVVEFDPFASPAIVDKTSSLGYAKREMQEYRHDYAGWVVRLPTRHLLQVGGVNAVTSETQYDGRNQPWKQYEFGKLKHTLGYWPDGSLATVTDGRGYTTQLNWYKRGIPTQIQNPDSTTQSASVNDDGWVTSVVNEVGASTGYGYDPMGRLASIVHPLENGQKVYNDTLITFVQTTSSEYGIPAGAWRRWEQTGNARKATLYDALWRPIVEESTDMGDPAGTNSWTAKRYDASGRQIFASYPRNLFQTGWVAWSSVTGGTYTTYDALDRATRVEQDSEHGRLATVTDYLPNFMTRVTNPRGFATVTSFQAFDEPAYDAPVGVTTAEDSATEIHRHPQLGRVERLIRRNGNGSLQATRSYVYDQYQQLCKVVEPETRATVMDYDLAGNLQWSASGLELMGTAPGQCDTIAGRDSGRKVTRTYDSRNRLTVLDFLDNNGDQSITYTLDGKPSQIVTYNDGGAAQVVNGYEYNKRGLLTRETSHQPGWYTWAVGYQYDGNASLSLQSYPNGSTVDYAPNALGQATRAGSFATGVSYYPNGAIKQFTYGNGLVHTMTQNARQLPARVTSSGGVSDYEYFYDGNANVHHINDALGGSGWSPLDKWMSYDGLDRLTDAGSGSFGGDHWHHFTYDALDNLKSWKHAGVKDYADYIYTDNKLTSIRNSVGATVVGLSYDAQGNLSQKNSRIHTFDMGNRLRAVDGQEWYRYDGLGRRVMAWQYGAGPILSVYSQSGQLMYEHNDRAGKGVDHVYLAGSLVASIDRMWATGVSVAKYQHTDALGSPVAVTNAAGQVIERMNWEPYGAAIGKTMQGPGFTGHVMDSATGLIYMQQRYYDPSVGRFLSVDPVAANVGAGFNRYSYAANNPYRFIDPDGRCPITRRNSQGTCAGGDGAAYVGNFISGVNVNSAESVGMANIPDSWKEPRTQDPPSSSTPDTVRQPETVVDDFEIINAAYNGKFHDELVRKMAFGINAAGAKAVTEVTLCLMGSTCARVDIMGRDPSGNLFSIEVKTGLRSDFTVNQEIVYRHLRKGYLVSTPNARASSLGIVPNVALPPINGMLYLQENATSPPFILPMP